MPRTMRSVCFDDTGYEGDVSLGCTCGSSQLGAAPPGGYRDKNTVLAVQEALTSTGNPAFDPQGIDGLWGPHTQNAVMNYEQATFGVATGIIDDELLASLGLQQGPPAPAAGGGGGGGGGGGRRPPATQPPPPKGPGSGGGVGIAAAIAGGLLLGAALKHRRRGGSSSSST